MNSCDHMGLNILPCSVSLSRVFIEGLVVFFGKNLSMIEVLMFVYYFIMYLNLRSFYNTDQVCHLST